MDYGIIPAGLVKLSEMLLSLVPTWLMARREAADRFADYCERIADLLDDTVAQLRRGRRPHGNCAELDRYMREAVRVLQNCVDKDDLAQVHDDLNFAYKVEYLDRAFVDPDEREKGYIATESAAGRFRALATTLRATGTAAAP